MEEASGDSLLFGTQVMSPSSTPHSIPVPVGGVGDSEFLGAFSAPPSPMRGTAGDPAATDNAAAVPNGILEEPGAGTGAGAAAPQQQDEGTERLVRLLVSALKNESSPKTTLRLAKMPTSGDHALPSVKEWTQ